MQTASGSFDITTGTTTLNIRPSAFSGKTPTGVKFKWTRRSSSGQDDGASDLVLGFGASDGTRHRSVSTWSQDDAGTTVASRGFHRTAIAQVALGGGGWDGEFTVNLVSGGFDVVISNAFSDLGGGVSFRITYQLFDIPNFYVGEWLPSTGTGTEDLTAPAFDVELAELYSAGVLGGSLATATQNNAGPFSVGFAASTSSEVGLCVDDRYNATDSNSRRAGHAGHLYIRINDGAAVSVMSRYELSAFITNGFRINKIENTGAVMPMIMYVAMAGAKFQTGVLSTRADSNDIVTSTPDMMARGLSFASVCDEDSGDDNAVTDALMSLGFATSPTERVCVAASAQDGLPTSECYTAIRHDAVFVRPNLADGQESRMDLTAIALESFTCVMDDAEPGSGDVSMVAYVVYGDAVTRTAHLPRHEAVALVERDAVARHEAIGSLVVQRDANYEAVLGLAPTALARHEVLSFLQVQRNARQETAVGLVVARVGRHEALIAGTAVADARHEVLLLLQVQRDAHHEIATVSVTRPGYARHEAIGTVSAQRVARQEAAGSLVVQIPARHEVVTFLQSQRDARHEALLGLMPARDARQEALGTLTVARDGRQEVIGIVSVARTAHHESLLRLTVSIGARHEVLAQLVATRVAHHECVLSLAVQRDARHELLGMDSVPAYVAVTLPLTDAAALVLGLADAATLSLPIIEE